MISQSVQDAIKGAIEMGDFSALYDYFADDVELKVAMAVGSPVPDERCKRSVVASLRRLGEAHLPADDGAPEFFANGERMVAFWDESAALRGGFVIHSQCTLVFDVHDGLIARLVIHHDLSHARASTPELPIGPDAPIAGAVVSHGQRDHAAGPRAG